jgi:hypothetical protein
MEHHSNFTFRTSNVGICPGATYEAMRIYASAIANQIPHSSFALDTRETGMPLSNLFQDRRLLR